MDETTPPTEPTGSAAPVTPSAPAPLAATPKELTPEEKAAKKKATLKRLAIACGVTYGVLLLLTVAWGSFLATQDLSIFDYLPVSQAGFNGFFWVLFNLLLGVVTVAVFLMALYGVLRSLLVKKEEVDKKKHFSRMGLWYGLGFLGCGILWLVGVWFLGPRLVVEERYGSPILTDPENTIGLTSPVTITFDASAIPVDTDTYSILSYIWDFGDGETGSGQTVQHEYTHKATGNGIYTVTLDVTYRDDKTGTQFPYSTSVEVSIENEQTSASFVANPDSGEVPLTVEFDATSSFDPDGQIVSYEWDFNGDGRYDDAEGEIVEYEFTQEGTYEVSLRVTDNNGDSATTTKTIEAGSVGGLRAIITPPLGEGAIYYINERYEFSGELSQYREQKIVKYKWDMGDGTKLEGRSAKHTYDAPGDYTVTLTVLDADGNSDDVLLELQVVEEGTPPKAKISTDPEAENGIVTGSVPLEITFDGTVSTDAEDDIVDYEWDFENDDEIDDSGSTVTYTYSETGSYEARLLVTDSAGNTSESTVEIVVTDQGVVAELSANVSSGEVPLTVSFDASGSTYKEGNIVSYEIDFGDGSDPYVGDATVTYKYSAVGTYTVTLTVVGDDGSKDTDSMQIVVRPVSLTACFTVNTTSGSAPLFIVVDPSCSQGTVKSYSWDFGDGEVSFDRKPETHTYDTAGTYTITLEVTGDSGIVDTFTKIVTAK
jgi:PKD repeat protein